jgi:hypothetical protein
VAVRCVDKDGQGDIAGRVVCRAVSSVSEVNMNRLRYILLFVALTISSARAENWMLRWTPLQWTNSVNALVAAGSGEANTAGLQWGSANLTNWSGVALFDTNGVTTAFIAADTVASNGLSARIVAAAQTNIPLSAVTNAGNIGYSNSIDFHTNGTVIVAPLQRIFPPTPQLVTVGTIALVSNTGYFCYIGKVEKTTTFARVQFQVTGAGNAAATNEVALFSSPNAPNATVQTLTRLAGSGVQTSTGSTGIKSNVTSMAVSIVQGTHLWAGIRSAILGVQPTCVGLSYDMLGGAVFTKATVNALTNVANATISSLVIPAFSTGTIAPSVRVTLD